MQEARDDVYSHLIARRAVARAALHLGSDSMTSESLDSLAACLIAYLERVGKTLAVSTEASGRSSAHCNVLDAVRAVELCTSAAVQRMHRDGSDDEPGGAGVGGGQQVLSSSGSGAISAPGDPQEELSWKGLAAFCFGPQWHSSSGISTMSPPSIEAGTSIQDVQSQQEQQDQLGQADESEQPLVESTSAAGGKVGLSATSIGVTGGDPTVKVVSHSAGWSAPYPDEIPAFPVPSSARIANPHPLHAQYLHGRPETSADAAESEKDQEKMGEELEEIPDAFFGWGELGAKEKPPRMDQEIAAVAAGSKRKEVTPDKETEPPRKKMKRSGDDGGEIPAEQNATSLYVPSFYPSFPQPSDSLARTILDAEITPFVSAPKPPAAAAASATKAKAAPSSSQAGTATDPTLKVRSALVQLGQHAGSTYWGSGWNVPASESKRQASELAVPVGRSAEAGGPAPQQIVPLGRASGHPVSRILEGSMDAATMQ
jgi:hypothetical protein